jgi:hypothetical protein
MDALDTTRAAQTKGTYEPSDTQPWIGIFQVTEDGMEEKKLCFIHGQYSEAVVVDLDRGNRAPFTKLVITSLPGTSDSVAASIKEDAAGRRLGGEAHGVSSLSGCLLRALPRPCERGSPDLSQR